MTMDSSSNVDASNSCRSGYTNDNMNNIDIEDNKRKESHDGCFISDENCEADETIVALTSSALIDVDGINTSIDDIQNHILANNFEEKKMEIQQKVHTI